MPAYTWEQIPEGETPEWGEWIKRPAWDDCYAERFVGTDPTDSREGPIWITAEPDWHYASGGWLRRVEEPHRWERWLTFAMEDGWMSMYSGKPNDWDTGGPRALVHIYCDADGELHIERVND